MKFLALLSLLKDLFWRIFSTLEKTENSMIVHKYLTYNNIFSSIIPIPKVLNYWDEIQLTTPFIINNHHLLKIPYSKVLSCPIQNIIYGVLFVAFVVALSLFEDKLSNCRELLKIVKLYDLFGSGRNKDFYDLFSLRMKYKRTVL